MATKRGRPPKNGMQPAWMLERGMEALYAYDEARRGGQKHSAAVRSAVEAIRAKYPRMPISETEVKRVLAQWRPQGGRIGILVTEPAPPDDIFILPNGQRARRGLTFGYGPRPNYPRINARTKQDGVRDTTGTVAHGSSSDVKDDFAGPK